MHVVNFDIGQGSIGFWTSASRLGKGDTYYWNKGEKVTFSDWAVHQPDNRIIDGEEEQCIEVKGFHTLKWNDNFCSHKIYYICET